MSSQNNQSFHKFLKFSWKFFNLQQRTIKKIIFRFTVTHHIKKIAKEIEIVPLFYDKIEIVPLF